MWLTSDVLVHSKALGNGLDGLYALTCQGLHPCARWLYSHFESIG